VSGNGGDDASGLLVLAGIALLIRRRRR
jgi:MYXO-CTERM domain-containing protein